MSTRRLRSSVFIRAVAAYLSGSLAAAMPAAARAANLPRAATSAIVAPAAAAAAQSTPPRAIRPPSAINHVLPVPLVPASVHWTKGADASDPWRLFDGDPSTTVPPSADGDRELAVTLPAATELSALTLLGPVDGTLSVLARDGAELRPLGDWSERDVRVPAGQWARLETRERRPVTELVLRWSKSATPLRELGLWGLAVPARSLPDVELADRLLSQPLPGALTTFAAPSERRIAKAASAVTFQAQLSPDPRALSRAFLVYELSGLGHWSQAIRQVNGLRAAGGAAATTAPRLSQGGLQVEEISPAWLRRGLNEVRFLPVDGDYAVRNLRIVGVPRGQVAESALDPSPRATSTIALAATSQPHELLFQLQRSSKGTLVVSAGKGKHDSLTIALADRETGWQRVALDGLPATAALGVAFRAEKTRHTTTSREPPPPLARLAVTASPLLADARPLVVTYPLHGECVDGKASLRGFVAGGADGVVALRANQQPIALGADRDFALAVAAPANGGDGWDIPVEATLASGRVARRDVHIDACVNAAADTSLVEDDGAPFGAVVRAGAAKTFSFGGTRLEIPAGAVDHDVRITVRPLVAAQVPAMSDLVANVSPDGSAFRFGPHGLKFKKPIKITLPYDAAALHDGMQEHSIYGFYYDEPQQKWLRIGRYGTAADGALASLTEHFTDFVNGAIAMPDEPGAKSFNPNEMNGIKLASPSAGLDLIAPPTANPGGEARLSYPIELPPGRRGVEPRLGFTYSNGGANGWLGVGWDLTISSISIDTRFGVPDYADPYFATKAVYLLDGEQVVSANDSSDGNHYQRRVEGRFDHIERIVDGNNCVTSFQVTDKSGAIYTYGGSGATLADPSNSCNAFRWHLSSVQDTFGNTMQVNYFTDRSGSSDPDPYVDIYPQSIDYTSNSNGLTAAYHVAFVLDQAETRKDIVVNGRAGFQVRTRYRLDHVDVLYQSTVIRRYQLAYQDDSVDHFHKSLLASIAISGLDDQHDESGYAGKQLDRHTFDYFAAESDGALAFGEQQVWGQLPIDSHDGVADSDEQAGGAGGSVGVGFGNIASVTVGAGGMGGDTWVRRGQPDIDGDGLPDIVDDSGNDAFNFLNPLLSTATPANGHLQGFSFNLPGSGTLGHTRQSGWNITGGVNIAGVAGAQTGYSSTSVTDDRILADVDGDGRPDVVTINNGNVTWNRNTGCPGGHCQYDVDRPIQNQLAPSSVAANREYLSAASAAGGIDRIEPLVRWYAPFDGNITIAGALQKLQNQGTGVVAAIYQCQDKCTTPQLLWQQTIASGDLSTCVPNAGSGCGGSGIRTAVHRGDRIYTTLAPLHDPSTPPEQLFKEAVGNDVSWAPTIAYDAPSAPAAALLEPYNMPIYNFDQRADFQLVGRPPAPWVAHSGGTVHIDGMFNKGTISDDVIVRITLIPSGKTPDPGIAPLYIHSFDGGTPTATQIAADINVNVGDQLLFETMPGTLYTNGNPSYPGTPIDFRQINWQPTVSYSIMCRVDVRSTSSPPPNICGAVICDPSSASCQISGDAADAKYPVDTINATPLIFQHATAMVQHGPTNVYVVPNTGTVNFSGNIGTASSSDVDVLVQGVNKLFQKTHIHQAGGQTFLSLPVQAQAGDELFVTIYSGAGDDISGSVVGSISADGTPIPINIWSRDLYYGDDFTAAKVGDDPMSGGFHRWYFGFYDGEAAFDEGQIVFPYDSKGNPNGKAFSLAIPAYKALSSDANAPLVPMWVGAGNAYITAGQEAATRTIVGGALGSGGVGSLRGSNTWNFDLSATLGVSFDWNHGQSESDHDFFDFNGDGYPDHVRLDGTVSYLRFPLPTDPGGTSCSNPPCSSFEARQVPGLNPDALHRVDHGTIKLGIGVSNLPLYNSAKSDGKSKKSASMGFDVSAKYGASTGSIDWVDVNGDGLPDLVRRSTSSSANSANPFQVQLNYGYKLGNQIPWPASNWSNESLASSSPIINALGSEGFDGSLNFPGSDVGLNGVRTQDSGTFSGSLGASGSSGGYGGGVGAGFSYTANRTVVDMVDMNGDGLPDQVMKMPGETGALRVRLNRGLGFDDSETIWAMPTWNVGSEPNDDTWIYQQLGDVGDGIDYGRGKSFDVGINLQYCWIICIGINAFYSNGSTWSDTKLEDVDGDGLPDLVYKPRGTSTIYVKLNKLNTAVDGNGAEIVAPVNALKAVHRPLGGTVTLTYGRAGNLIRSDLSPTVDEPHNKYVLASVDVNDNFNHHYTQSMAYGANGFYDRTERDDYGFAQVTTTREDLSTVESDFYNHDFYRKGLPAETATRDAAGNLFAGEIITYADPTAAPPQVRVGSFFPSKATETTNWYEGQTTNFGSPPKSKIDNYRTWDAYGNLIDYETHFDDGAANDVYYHVDYDPSLASHYIFRAKEVQAHAGSSAGMLLRDRQATYDSRGALLTLTNVLIGGSDPASGSPYTGAPASNPTWTYQYDPFGNVVQEVDPRQYTLNYTFDAVAQTYLTSTSDSFGYTSSSVPNYMFGATQSATDVNGNIELYNYDSFGRLSTVYGPNDVALAGTTTDFCSSGTSGAAEPTIVFCYSEGSANPTLPAYAVSRHKDVQHPGDPVVTSTFVDGIERVIQTKKDLERDTGSGTQVGMSVSGAITFDVRGRFAQQDQPVFDPGSDPTSYYVSSTPPNRQTVIGYDILDRRTSLQTPDGALATTSYGFDTLDGTLRLATVTRDPNVNAGGGLPGTVRESFSDVRGLVLGVQESNRLGNGGPTTLLTRYQYDPVDELTQVTDANGNVTTAGYDTLGHMVMLNSPDSGLTKWRYDLSGNVGAKETARLRKNNQLIRYQYQFNRLASIQYPTTPAVTYVYGSAAEQGGPHFNLAGRLKSETSEAGTKSYQYDALGNKTQERWLLHTVTYPNQPDYDHTTAYTHDSFDRVLTVSFGDSAQEVVSYGYDHGGSVTSVIGVNTNPQKPGTTMYVSQVGYDEFGERTRLNYGNGISATYQYDPLNRRLTNVSADQRDPTLVQLGKPARPFERMAYQYDPVGNITEIRNDAPYDNTMQSFVLPATVKQDFTYDDLYQLKTAAGTYQEQSTWRLKYGLGFSYDAIGNIVSKAQTNDRQYAQGSQWQEQYSIADTSYSESYTYGGSRPHAPTLVNETDVGDPTVKPKVIEYDENGNQKDWTYQVVSRRDLVWDDEDRVQQVKTNGVQVALATYDGDGERAVNFQVPASGGAYLETAYFGADVTLRDATYVTKHIFLGSTRIASKLDASWLGPYPTTVYFHDDQLGSTNFLTNDTQQLIAHQEYFPSGELWVDEDDARYVNRQAYLFNGKELDAATGLYYYGARYYDPRLSQWISPDPILNQYVKGCPNAGVFLPSNLGLYAYAHNNPVVLTDRNGLWPDAPTDPASARTRGVLSSYSAGTLWRQSLWDMVVAAPNLRPRTVEALAQSGQLGSSTSFIGVAGEFSALQSLLSENLQLWGTANIAPVSLQDRHPDGRQSFDFSIAFVGVCEACGGVFPSHAQLTDTIGPGTGGRVGTVDLGHESSGLFVEVTTSRNFADLNDRAHKVGSAQGIYDITNKIPGLSKRNAALAIDRGTYFQMSDADKATLRNSVGTGSIILVRDLQKNARAIVNNVQSQIR